MFNIFRSQTATAALKHAWEEATEQQKELILRASVELDRLLQHNPQDQGEAREGSQRILFHNGVAALFEVDPTRKLVTILNTWKFQTAADRRTPRF